MQCLEDGAQEMFAEEEICASYFIYFLLFWLFRSAPESYGGFQAWGQVGAVAAGLGQSHSNAGSEPCLQPTPQLTATPDL